MEQKDSEQNPSEQIAVVELSPDQTKTEDCQYPEKIWNAMFINICIVNITMSFGQFMMNTLIPKFMDSLGAVPTMVGMITSIFVFSSLAAKPISGPAIDSLPKKKVLFSSMLLITSAFVFYAVANNLAFIIIGRIIHGIGMSFSVGTSLAVASAALPKNKLSQGLGFFSLGQAMASAVGPAIGLFFADRFGYNITFGISACVVAFSAFLALIMKKPPEVHKEFKITLDNMFAKEAVTPAILQLFISMAYAPISSFLVLYAQNDRGVADIGFWFTVNALCMLVTRPIIGRLADKYGIHKVMLPAVFMFALSLFVISISNNIAMFLFSAMINACGYGTIIPTISAMTMKCVTPERRGVGANTTYIGLDLGFISGPILAGAFVTSFGYSNMYMIMIIPVVITAVLFVLLYPKIKAICTK